MRSGRRRWASRRVGVPRLTCTGERPPPPLAPPLQRTSNYLGKMGGSERPVDGEELRFSWCSRAHVGLSPLSARRKSLPHKAPKAGRSLQGGETKWGGDPVSGLKIDVE